MTLRTSVEPVRSTLAEADMQAFAQDAKIGLLATVSAEGLPHVSLITSLQAKNSRQLMFGQFTEGQSKVHVKSNPRVGFLIMSPRREVWRGTARWTHAVRSGEDYDLYNRKPMFRYNAYFGVHTVHYLDLLSCRGPERLFIPGIVAGSLLARACGAVWRFGKSSPALRPWAQRHLSRVSTLKFLCCVDDAGYPVIVPVVPASAAGPGKVLLIAAASRRDLLKIPRGAVVSLFALNLQMESVLVRGEFGGFRGYPPLAVGTVDIDWVYNSMPPKQGQIFPEPPLQPVVIGDAARKPFAEQGE